MIFIRRKSHGKAIDLFADEILYPIPPGAAFSIASRKSFFPSPIQAFVVNDLREKSFETILHAASLFRDFGDVGMYRVILKKRFCVYGRKKILL